MDICFASSCHLYPILEADRRVKTLSRGRFLLLKRIFLTWRVKYLSSTWVSPSEIMVAQVFRSWRIVHLTQMNQVTVQRAVHAEVRVGLIVQILKEFVGSHALLKEKGYDEWIDRAASGDDLHVCMDRMKRTITLRKGEKRVTFASDVQDQRRDDRTPVTVMMSQWAHHVPVSWTIDDVE